MIKKFNFLDASSLGKLTDQLQPQVWSDGKKSARGDILTKKNKQILLQKDAPKIFELLYNCIFQHFDLRLLARPKLLMRPVLNRYDVGDHYDWHFDSPIIDTGRADLSFTIFLDPSDSYDGGSLQIESLGTRYEVKGEPGEILLYSNGQRHRVTEVTKGSRTCIVGWIQSWIRDSTAREDAALLEREIHKLSNQSDPPIETVSNLTAVLNHFLWREV